MTIDTEYEGARDVFTSHMICPLCSDHICVPSCPLTSAHPIVSNICRKSVLSPLHLTVRILAALSSKNYKYIEHSSLSHLGGALTC